MFCINHSFIDILFQSSSSKFRMAPKEVIIRSGRSVKIPIQKYEQKCVMNADKVANYKRKVKNTKMKFSLKNEENKQKTLERVRKHREEMKLKKSLKNLKK